MFKILLVIALLLAVTIVIDGRVLRLLKSVILIARIEPFEQTVPDADIILVLGDSTGYGTGATGAKDTVAGRIGADFPTYSVRNMSKNGRTIDELNDFVDTLAGTYALILLQIGGNDVIQKRDVAVVEKELRSIVAKLASHTDHLVMMSTGNVGGVPIFTGEKEVSYEKLTREFRNMFMRVAADTTLTYVDLFLEPEDDFISNQPEIYIAMDGLHLTSAGYAVWYEKLKPVIKPNL